MSNRFTQYILLAMVLGIAMGTIVFNYFPDSRAEIAADVNLIAMLFLRLIKMIIAPLVFATLVGGIAHMGSGAKLGRIFAKTMGWFVSASFVSLLLGLVMVNLLQPGANFPGALPDKAQSTGLPVSAFSIEKFLTHLIPTSIADAMALTRGLTSAEARFKPSPDSWWVLEVVCHLYDLEREDFRWRLDAILHRPAEEWIMTDPQGWITTRRYNERDLSQTLDGFLAERERSLAWLKTLAAPNWEAEHVSQFGSMKAGEMFATWVAHDNLHIRQLVELRRVRIVSLAEPFDVGYAGEW